MIYRIMQAVAAAALMFGAVGASCDSVSPNVYAPLSGTNTLAIINETPYRAIFTGGAYDNLDEKSVPEVGTVLLESQGSSPEDMGVIWLNTKTCRRALAVGSPELLKLVKDQKVTVTNETALITGVNFSDAPKGSPDETNPTRGTAEPFVALQGVDYPCGSYVIFRMKEDAAAPGGFKVVLDGVIF